MDFQQTDDAANASALISQCSGALLNTDKDGVLATVGGSAGSTPVTTELDASASSLAAVWWELTLPANSVLQADDWVIRKRISALNANCSWIATYICRVNSSYISQELIGSQTMVTFVLSKNQVNSRTIAGIASTPAAGDKIVIVNTFSNSQGTPQSFGWTPDQIITAPIEILQPPVGSLATLGVGR